MDNVTVYVTNDNNITKERNMKLTHSIRKLRLNLLDKVDVAQHSPGVIIHYNIPVMKLDPKFHSVILGNYEPYKVLGIKIDPIH